MIGEISRRFVLQYCICDQWIDWCAFVHTPGGKASAILACEQNNQHRLDGTGWNVKWRVIQRTDRVVS